MAHFQLNFPKTFFFVFLISFSAAQLSTAAISSFSASPKISSPPPQNSTKNLLQNLTTFSQQQSNISCYFDSTCYDRSGMHSRCYNGACICDLGYFPSSLDADCSRVYCTTDDQCLTFFPNTVCQTSSFAGGSCICDQSSHLDLKSQQCKRPQPTTYCTSNYECWSQNSYGSNSFCNGSSLCQCDMGYTQGSTPAGEDLGCNFFTCSDNFDCSSRWANTECGIFGSCICGSHYQKNYVTQKCDYIGGGDGGDGGGGDGKWTKKEV